MTSSSETVFPSRLESTAETPLGSEICVLQSREQVEGIREIWSAWSKDRDSDIDFCQDVVWKRDEVIRPHVIVLRRNGVPEAMLVGRLEHTLMTSKLGYFSLPGIPALSLTFSYGGLLGHASPENCEKILASVMKSLRNNDADIALLDHLTVGTSLHELALGTPGLACRDHLCKPETHYRMSVPADMQEVFSRLSGSHRSAFRRKAKKFAADFEGGLKVKCHQRLEEVDELMQVAEQIAKGTYQRGLGVGFQCDEETRRRLQLYAEKGWLRAYVLHVGDTPCAFWIGGLYRGCFCSDYLAFDTRFSAYSPGLFLMMNAVEEFCASGVREIDFGFGEARYKEQFGNSPASEASVLLFAPTIKGATLNGLRTSAEMANNLAKTVFEKTGLLPRLKKFWRNRVTKEPVAE